MFEQGYIKMFRKVLSWEWYQDANTARLFFHLLLTVQIKDSKYMGVDIPKGSRVASVATLAKELGLTTRQIRTGLEHLETSNEVTRSKHSRFSVISIVRWNDYQEERQTKRSQNDKQNDKQATSERQHNKKERSKEEKNIMPDGDSASHPFYDLSPSKMQPLDESPEERSDRLKKLRES